MKRYFALTIRDGKLFGLDKLRETHPWKTKEKGKMRIDNQLVRWRERKKKASKDSLRATRGSSCLQFTSNVEEIV